MIQIRRLSIFIFALTLIAAVGQKPALAQGGQGGSTVSQPGGSTGSEVGGALPIRSTSKTTIKRGHRSGQTKKQQTARIAAPAQPAQTAPAAPSAAPALPSAEAALNEGNDYYDRGLYKEAVEAYKRALQLKPNDAETYSSLGDAHFNLRQYAEAITAYSEALRLKPDDAATLYALGDAYANLKRDAEAAETYAKANKQALSGKVQSGGVLNTKAIRLPPPVYPPIARAARVSGTVEVRVIIDENGDVLGAEVLSGHPLLRAAARNAAIKAKFSPVVVDGQPVRVSGVINYNFIPS